MDFLKKHYEKILLSAVLLGLAVAAGIMLIVIPSEQQKVKDIGTGIIRSKVQPLPDLDLTPQTNILEKLQSPYNLDFDTTNKIFNPVEWQKTQNGILIKASSLGADAATVTKITPLYFVLTLDSVITNESGLPRYVIGFERQAAPYASQRHGERYVSLDDSKKDLFTLLNVQGAPANPDQLILKLADTDETITLTNGIPFQRADAYSADLRYDPEKKVFSGRRVGSVLPFAGDDYTIVDIKPNEVILSAQSNQKRTTLQYAP